MSFVCKGLTQPPSRKPWQRGFTNFMIGASIVGQVYLGLQAFKSYSSQKVEGLSMYSFIALGLGYMFWIFYAAFVTIEVDLPVLLGSSIGLALTISIIVAIAIYGENIWRFT